MKIWATVKSCNFYIKSDYIISNNVKKQGNLNYSKSKAQSKSLLEIWYHLHNHLVIDKEKVAADFEI